MSAYVKHCLRTPLRITMLLVIIIMVTAAASYVHGASIKTIPAGENQYSGTIDYYGDGDLYTFTLNSPASMFILLETGCPEIGYGLKTDSGQYINVRDGNVTLPIGTYYLEVVCVDCNDSGIYGSYTLETRISPMYSKDTTEPNNSPEEAVLLKNGVKVEGTAYYQLDYDWYKLNLEEKSRVDFLINRAPAYSAVLYDSTLKQVTTIESSYTGEPQRETLEAGTYYIQMYEHANLTANYNLMVTVYEHPSMPKITNIKQNRICQNTIKWTTSTNADGYEIYRRIYGEDRWYLIAKIDDGDVNQYVDYGAPAPGILTGYSIKAYRSMGTGWYDLYSDFDEDGTTITGTVPTPYKIKATVSSGDIKVSWSEVSYTTGYKVYRKTNGGNYKLVKTIKDGKTASWTDKSAVKGKIYSYKVKAYYTSNYFNYATMSTEKKTYYSKYTAVVKKQMTGTISAPSKVTTKKYKSYNKVSWKKNIDAAGYKVYRKIGSGNYKLVKTISSTSTTSWKDKNVKKGKKYTYKVKAYYQSYYYTNAGKLKYKNVYSKYSKTSSVKR